MRQFAAVALFLVIGGCKQHGVVNAGPDMAPMLAFAPHDKVDILFMIDNSAGESYKVELRNRFAQLIEALDAAAGLGHPASYHIGVVTSDLGAGPSGEICHPGGDGGKLQAASASGLSASCANFSLGGGLRFIDYDQITGTNNIMGGLGVADAFKCISDVGDIGCGFQHPLESVYRALRDPPPENAGFLRDDALLAVFFITDEDDCSAPPDTDLFDSSPDGVAKYGALQSFRCTQFGIACGSPAKPLDGSAVSGLTDCRPLAQAEGGKLFDVQRYIDLFTRPDGVKRDPSDVILASIMAPPAPVGVTVTAPCADQMNTPSCPILDHSCTVPTNAALFGDPAVRLAAVVGAAYTSSQNSMCATDYSGYVDAFAQKIVARLK